VRPSVDEYFIKLAELVATRSTCLHRQQGAILVRDNRIISTGYNGAPPGAPHCTDYGYCAKDKDLGFCRAEGLHGESNAIATAAKLGISTDETTMYTVYSPCRSCCNLMKVAGVTVLVYKELYNSFPQGPGYLREELRITVRKLGK